MTTYLIAFNDEWVPAHTSEELRAKGDAARAVLAEMKDAGVFLFSDGGLDRSSLVASVTAVDGKPMFSDGPYAETKEHLGGLCVIEVPDDETAKRWAGLLTTALDWPQELYRFPTFAQIHGDDD